MKIQTSNDYDTSELRLLELNPSLEKAIQDQEAVIFCGKRTQGAVLCTTSESFHVFEEETSNLILLLNGSMDVCEKENDLLECVPVSGSSSSFLKVSKLFLLGVAQIKNVF